VALIKVRGAGLGMWCPWTSAVVRWRSPSWLYSWLYSRARFGPLASSSSGPCVSWWAVPDGCGR